MGRQQPWRNVRRGTRPLRFSTYCFVRAVAPTAALSGMLLKRGGVDARGKWRTADKEIVITWSDGTSERWGYFISGGSMLFKSGSSKKLWKRVY